MPPELTDKDWAQIRHDYEHTDRLVDDICAGHGISAGTLRDRMRRWGWTRRRPPVPREGPAAAPPAELAALLAGPLPPDGSQSEAAMPRLAMAAQSTAHDGAVDGVAQVGEAQDDAPRVEEALDEKAMLLRLQGAVARVIPAIEATVAKLATSPMRPREMESSVRTLATLTRTLRELNGLIGARQANAHAVYDDMPEDIDAFRHELARRINALAASYTAQGDQSRGG